ncbi:hypothetical protein CDAR_124491 [Caerostris darwini]|uniref:Uncharacterized protein n=1 Tax=Caerostris darwini TaxID=1538125 RepID=A0AAV4RMC8_9ARAC|nr:hypothetical protein CDAR_124491 [Caerostris darwini]
MAKMKGQSSDAGYEHPSYPLVRTHSHNLLRSLNLQHFVINTTVQIQCACCSFPILMSEHVVDQRDAVLRHVQEAKDDGLKDMGFLGNNSYTCGRISYHYLEDAFFCSSCPSCLFTTASRLCTS